MVANETIVSQPRPVATLVIQGGSQAGTSFPVSGDEAFIGREEGLHVVLQDEESSRRHARISWLAGQFMIEDLGSTNGTKLNGVPISTPQMLYSGDKISIGQTTLVFEMAAASLEKISPHETILKADGLIPSRHVLTTASETNERLGNENLGFLSESHGFMPTNPPRLQLPAAFQAWDEMVERLPELFRTLTLRKTF